jgi:SAM-dependent methyltransferase
MRCAGHADLLSNPVACARIRREQTAYLIPQYPTLRDDVGVVRRARMLALALLAAYGGWIKTEADDMTPTQPDEALLALPFDQYGRYQMMCEALEAARSMIGLSNDGRLRVLDVGGFFRTAEGVAVLPARMFLPADDVTVLDQASPQPGDDLPGYVQGDGRVLDFADQSFDIVISCDTLEHVPAADRPAFWRELLRVARHGVLLAAPFGLPEVVAAEDLLFRYIQAELGVEQPQLREHRDYGLPALDATRALLDGLGLDYRVYPSGYVHSWLVMMLARHYLSLHIADPGMLQQLDRYYIRFLRHGERREPAYRHMFAVAKDASNAWLAPVHTLLWPTIQQEEPHPPDAAWPALAQGLLQLLGIQLASQRHHGLHTLLQGITAQLAADAQAGQELRQELARRDQQLADLEQRARWYEAQARDAQRQLAAVENGRVLRILRWLTGANKR